MPDKKKKTYAEIYGGMDETENTLTPEEIQELLEEDEKGNAEMR